MRLCVRPSVAAPTAAVTRYTNTNRARTHTACRVRIDTDQRRRCRCRRHIHGAGQGESKTAYDMRRSLSCRVTCRRGVRRRWQAGSAQEQRGVDRRRLRRVARYRWRYGVAVRRSIACGMTGGWRRIAAASGAAMTPDVTRGDCRSGQSGVAHRRCNAARSAGRNVRTERTRLRNRERAVRNPLRTMQLAPYHAAQRNPLRTASHRAVRSVPPRTIQLRRTTPHRAPRSGLRRTAPRPARVTEMDAVRCAGAAFRLRPVRLPHIARCGAVWFGSRRLLHRSTDRTPHVCVSGAMSSAAAAAVVSVRPPIAAPTAPSRAPHHSTLHHTRHKHEPRAHTPGMQSTDQRRRMPGTGWQRARRRADAHIDPRSGSTMSRTAAAAASLLSRRCRHVRRRGDVPYDARPAPRRTSKVRATLTHGLRVARTEPILRMHARTWTRAREDCV